MRRFLIGLAFYLASAAVVMAAQQAATAEPSCQVIDPRTGQCTIFVEPDPEPRPPAEDDGPKQTQTSSSR